MCQFKSAIVVKDKQAKGGFRILLSPWTESHSDLIIIHKLNDTAKAKLYFARIEFSPPDMSQAHLVDTYKLRIDEERTPDWFDDEKKELVTAKMRDYIKSIIVDGDAALLIGGQFILGPKAKIEAVKTCVINACFGSKIDSVSGSAKIDHVYGDAKIDYVYGDAKIDHVSGSAKIDHVYGDAKIVTDNRKSK